MHKTLVFLILRRPIYSISWSVWAPCRYWWLFKLHWQFLATWQCVLLHFEYIKHLKKAQKAPKYYYSMIEWKVTYCYFLCRYATETLSTPSQWRSLFVSVLCHMFLKTQASKRKKKPFIIHIFFTIDIDLIANKLRIQILVWHSMWLTRDNNIKYDLFKITPVGLC